MASWDVTRPFLQTYALPPASAKYEQNGKNLLISAFPLTELEITVEGAVHNRTHLNRKELDIPHINAREERL